MTATTDPRAKGLVDKSRAEKNLSSRDKKNSLSKWLFFACTVFVSVVLTVLLVQTLVRGVGYSTPEFFTSFSSSIPPQVGTKDALTGTLWLMITIIPISIILGVGTAIYSEEYARDNMFTSLVRICIPNLAGIPSIVFGLLSLILLVYGTGIESLSLGNTVITAALTMSLLILPTIIISSQEAIRAAPNSVREASHGLGGDKWQIVGKMVLPAALPDILTGFILSLSYALGEAAPLILIDIPTIFLAIPSGLFSMFTALPTQIYTWVKMLQAELQDVASAGIIVLLAILLLMSGLAVFLHNKFSGRY